MREIKYKKLGAYQQARAIEIITSMLGADEIRAALNALEKTEGIDAGADSAFLLVGVVQVIVGQKFESVCKLIYMTTDIKKEELQADGDDAIGLDEVVAILIKAYEINDFGNLTKRLGNVLTPLTGKVNGSAATAQPDDLERSSYTPSAGLMAGQPERLMKSV